MTSIMARRTYLKSKAPAWNPGAKCLVAKHRLLERQLALHRVQVQVHADAHDVAAGGSVRREPVVDRERIFAEVVVHVFSLGGPPVGERKLHTAADGPAGEPLGLAIVWAEGRRHGGTLVLRGLNPNLSKRHTGLCIEQGSTPGMA